MICYLLIETLNPLTHPGVEISVIQF